ncbi:MAG TPA: glycosyltransferase, partial [Anaerolineales bacterium]|nr:glycosyltransferase [Anaerolineales bacterium]
MRIAYVALGVEPRNLAGGVGRKLRTQTAIWAELGHAARLFALVPECPDPEIYTYSPASWAPGLKGLTRSLSRSRSLHSLMGDVRDFRPDIIYLRAGAYIYPLHSLFSIDPVVMELNSNDIVQKSLQGRYAYWSNVLTRGILLGRAAGLIAVTREIGELPGNRRYRKPTRVIGNGIDLRDFESMPAPTHSVPTVTLVGSPGMPWHGVDKLVRLAELCPDLNICIGGYGPEDIDVTLPTNVRAIGFLEPRAVRDVLRETDVACGSLALHRNNMQEGSTLKVPEALAYGIPVLLGYRDTAL